jgi:hypothetical protein
MDASRARRVRVIAERAAATLATAGVADDPVSRMVGLLRHRSLARGDGLVIEPCSMVHTWFMRFAIDVLFLDRAGTVVASVDTLRPFRMAWGGWRARITIELPAGTLRGAGVGAGERIRMEPA